jgi:hypothetical protein
VRCYDDARAFIAERRDAERRRRVFAEAYPKGTKIEGAQFAAIAGRALSGPTCRSRAAGPGSRITKRWRAIST